MPVIIQTQTKHAETHGYATLTPTTPTQGAFNIQALHRDDRLAVIETNLRASRSLPFVSKVPWGILLETFTLVHNWFRWESDPNPSPPHRFSINESSLGLVADSRNIDFDGFLSSVAPWGFDGRRNAPTWS